MSTDKTLVLALEERLFNAWPALETVHCDGYLFRFANGHTKRANAVSAWKPSSMPVEEVINEAERAYHAARLPPLFRITPLCDPALDAALDARGWEFFEPSLVLTRALDETEDTTLPEGVTATLEPEASPQWVAGAGEAYGFAPWQIEVLGEIVARIRRPAAFATMSVDGEPTGYGFAVADRGYVGLYDLAVNGHHRSRGVGRAMITQLLRFGQEQGAATAYLQMREENTRSHALYSTLGFRMAYRYTHRRKR